MSRQVCLTPLWLLTLQNVFQLCLVVFLLFLFLSHVFLHSCLLWVFQCFTESLVIFLINDKSKLIDFGVFDFQICTFRGIVLISWYSTPALIKQIWLRNFPLCLGIWIILESILDTNVAFVSYFDQSRDLKFACALGDLILIFLLIHGTLRFGSEGCEGKNW